MNCLLSRAISVAFFSVAVLLSAEEKKEAERPGILLASPFALIRGQTNRIRFRGDNLTSLSNVVVSGAVVSLGPASDAKPPDGVDPKIAGRQRLDCTVYLPQEFQGSNLTLILSSTNGFSITNSLLVVSARTVDEIEPNGGFRNAMKISTDCLVRASIDPKKDVDVFALELTQPIHIEIQAAQFGSVLDSILTIYNSSGSIFASNDDANGRDSRIEFAPPSAGTYYIAVQDAHDRGGETHPYLLRVSERPASQGNLGQSDKR